VAVASPAEGASGATGESGSTSASGDVGVGGQIQQTDSPAKKDLEKGIDLYMHHNLRDAITTLKQANTEDPKNAEVIFWLFKSNQDLEIKHTRQSESYAWALKLVALAPGTTQGQEARDYVSAVDSGTAVNNERKGARELGTVQAGYTTCRVSVVDVQNERFAGILFTHTRTGDSNNILLTPQQWLKFVALFNDSMKKWSTVKDKKVQVGELEGMTFELNNAAGTTVFEIQVSTTDADKPQEAPKVNDLVLDEAGAAKLSVLMTQMTDELRPLLPQKVPAVMAPPVPGSSAPVGASGASGAPAASGATGSSAAPAPASPAKK
jgi:hypothetical protein